MISLAGVSKTYSKRGQTQQALVSTDLQIQTGEFAMIVGRSGAGKSTLLGIAGGLLRPTTGQVLLQEHTLWELSEQQRARLLLRDIGLEDRASATPDQISGGEKRRVAVASALMNNPPLLLADEPTGELDPETETQIMALLKQANEQGTTVLLVTHNHHLTSYAQRVFMMDEGRLSEQGGQA